MSSNISHINSGLSMSNVPNSSRVNRTDSKLSPPKRIQTPIDPKVFGYKSKPLIEPTQRKSNMSFRQDGPKR